MCERGDAMKILFVTWYIYDPRIEVFCNNCTGGGLVIKNLCEYVGRKEESYLLIGRHKLPEMKLENINIVGTDKYENVIVDEDVDANEIRLRTMVKAFADAIDVIQPDIVSIQGLGEFAKRCLSVCCEKNIPNVITDHLYIGVNEDIDRYDICKEWAKEIYSIPRLNVIAVSNGMKNKILKDYPLLDGRLYAIANGTDFQAVNMTSNFLEKYNLKNKKVMLCVGTILDRKNQRQIVRAFKYLPDEVRNNIAVIFCGKDRLDGKLQCDIEKEQLGKSLIYVGACSSEDMKKYYSLCKGLIMPSFAEGLSIAALETIAYGQPVIMFGDSECYDDLNDERVVQIAKERTDECLADAIVKWYEKEWDNDYIINFSKYFTMERMADDHINEYKRIIGLNL